jgi:hypothetical protein
VYLFFVVKKYSSLGYDAHFVVVNYIASWVGMMFCSALAPKYIKGVSEFFYLIALIMLITPIASLYGLSGRGYYPYAVSVISVCVIGLGLKINFGIRVKSHFSRYGIYLSVFLSLLVVIYFLFWSVLSGAIKNFNLDPMLVYNFREVNAELMNVGLMAYLNIWAFKVFNPFLISFFLLRKKYLYMIVFCGVQFIMYGVTAQKSVLAPPIIIGFVWLLYYRRLNIYFIPLLAAAGVIICYLFYLLLGSPLLAYLFVWRTLFVPADLTYLYFNFFSVNEFVFWSNSFLSSFVLYPYSTDVSQLLGDFQGTGWSANNGFISKGYSNAGLFGVLFYSLIVIFILKVLDRFCYKNREGWFTLSLVLPHFISILTSVDLLTTLLTHGFSLVIIIVVLVYDERQRVVLS